MRWHICFAGSNSGFHWVRIYPHNLTHLASAVPIEVPDLPLEAVLNCTETGGKFSVEGHDGLALEDCRAGFQMVFLKHVSGSRELVAGMHLTCVLSEEPIDAAARD